MKTRKMVIMSLLLGIGVVLHLVMPGFFFGMKPDMMLVTMILGIILFPDVKSILLLSVGTGILSALTTSFPGGQIPNIIDKFITGFVVLFLVLILKRLSNEHIRNIVITVIGTFVSGTIFLVSALFVVGLPGNASLITMIVMVVLPTTLLNAVFISIIYPVSKKATLRINGK